MNRIKEVLKGQGRSQKWLAEQIGMSQIMINNYCNNKAQPKVEILYEMAKLLNVEVSDLLVSTKDLSE